jgi:hypothetical protein
MKSAVLRLVDARNLLKQKLRKGIKKLGFHQIGLHGGVAVPFLTGLGCNVPAISSAAKATSGRERVIASVLITFVPCSASCARNGCW